MRTTVRKRRPAGRSNRRGGVLVLVAISLVALMGVAALSIDGGRMLAERRQVQAAADAAASAGALEHYLAQSKDNVLASEGAVRAKVLAIAEANGYPNDGAESIVTVNSPPRSGQYARHDGFVEVIVESRLGRSFSAIFSREPIVVRGRSVAAGTEIDTVGSVLVLDPKKKHAVKLKGKDASLKLAGDLIINSRNKKALKLDRKFQVTADHILVAGGVEKQVRKLTGTELETGVNPTPDPLAGLPAPAKGPLRDPKNYATGTRGNEIFRLQPGTYAELKFDKQQTVYLEPGTYYVEGKVSFKGDSNLSGDGVTIYMVSSKEFKLHTKGTVHLTPAASGPYEGISIFVDPTKKGKVTFKKDAELDLQGMIYAPNAKVEFKEIDAELGGYFGESDEYVDDALEQEDEEASSDEPGLATQGSLGASIIARELSVDKKSHLRITGVNIQAKRPILGIVE